MYHVTRGFIVMGMWFFFIGINGTLLSQDNKCDVIVQSGSSIQDAINSASPGETICVEPGVYEEDLIINTNSLTITAADEGENPVNTGSITVSGVQSVLVSRFTIQDVNSDGVVIENSTGVEIRENQLINNHNGVTSVNSSQLVIEGNEIKDQQLGFRSGYGIDIESSDSVQIKNNLIAENPAKAIRLISSHYALITNNEIIDNSDSGVYLEESDSATVIGNTLNDQNAYGIRAVESLEPLFEDNIITGNRFGGIIVREYSHMPVIIGNTISGHDADIIIIESAYSELRNNTMDKGLIIDPNNIRSDFDAGRTYFDLEVENNTVNGGLLYYVKNTDNPDIPSDAEQVIIYNSTNVNVSDMEFSNVSVGLQIAYSNTSVISNVTAHNHVYDGVRLIVCHNSTVKNSMFNDNNKDGLYLESSEESNIIENSGLNNGRHGIIAFWSAGTVINNNSAFGNGENGIYLSNSREGEILNSTAGENKVGIVASRSNRSVVHNNVSNDNTEYGFRLGVIRNPEVTDNIARNNGFGGMRFGSAEWTGELSGNELTHNERDGLWIQTWTLSNNDITVSDNILSDNGRHGIYLPRSDEVSVIGNVIERNAEDGIHLGNSDDVSIGENTVTDNGGYGLYMGNRFNTSVFVDDNTFSGHTVDLYMDELMRFNRIRDNSFETGILIAGDEQDNFGHIISNNTVSGKELFFSRNDDVVIAPDDPGQIIVVNADRIDIDSLQIDDVAAGLQIAFTDTVFIQNSNFSRNTTGVNLVGNELYQVENNTFQNNNTGLHIQGEFTPATLVNNEFLINEVGLNAQNLDGVADARNNWWGDASGPGGGIEDPETGTIADGNGDVIDGTVRFDPWLGSGTELDAPFFTVTIDSTNSPVQATEELIVDVTVMNEGDGAATREIELYDFDGDIVDSAELTLDATDNVATITLVWATDEGDAGEGEVTVHSQDDSDTVSVLIDDVTSITDDPSIVEEYQLSQNYPNPFNPSTTIRFAIVESGRVQLIVYDLLGRKVKTLIEGHTEAGYHDVVFDAGHLSSGMYIYQIRAGEFVETKRLLLLK